MREKIKTVIIGAGSWFTRGVLVDLASHEALQDCNCEVALVDIDETVLNETFKVGKKICEHFNSSIKIHAATDRREVLSGADYIIMSVERNRYTLWEQDFRVPLSYGFRHILGENGGPGAIFHAIRNYEIVLPICHDIVKLCPKATILNFTNPEARILMAITKLTNVKVLGFCHGVLETRDEIAKLLNRDLNDLYIQTGGMNHFFWVLKVEDAKSGKNLYPELRKQVMASCQPLVRKMMEIYGYFTYPSDNHIGEYLSFAHEFTGIRWPYGVEVTQKAAPHAPSVTWRKDSLTGKMSLEQLMEPSGEIVVEAIVSILKNKKQLLPSINVPNTNGYVTNLPDDAIVEVPAIFDASGAHPVTVGAIPEPLAAFTNLQISIQRLLVEAYKQKSKKMLLQALLLDPVVDSVKKAEELIDYMLELQKEYLPKFH